MAKYLSNRQQNLNIGIVSYTEDKTVLEVTGKVGIGTTNATSKLHVVGDARITGVVTATTFVGALTGTASSTTNIPNLTGAITSNNTTTSLGSFTSDQLSTALSDKTGTGVAVFATSPTLVTPVLGAASATSIVVSSGSTFTNGPILVGSATSTGTASQPLQVTGGAYVSGSVGIGTTNPTRTLDVNGDIRVRGGLYDVNNQSGTSGQLLVSTETGVDWQDATEITVIQNILNTTLTGIGISEEGVGIGTTFTRINFIGPGVTASANGTSVNVTVADYVSNAGIATSATQLVTPRTFQITGDVIASPISFDGTGNVSLAATIQPNSVGLGTDTTGDYVRDITGTANQITVTGGTGEGSTPTLSIPSQFTAPQDVTVTRDLLVSRNLNVDGNITIGGTSALLDVQRLQISDADVILGVRTDAFGNDVSNDNTANHGGISVASTEGNPLVQLVVAGIETLPPTYKKIMWFKAGSFSGLGTDAWLINYAVGIGSTQFPTGTRLAAGNVQFTQNDLAVVRNINSSGIVTATTFVGALTGTATSTTNIPNLTGAITSNNTTTSLGSFSSSDLATALTDETGSGSAVFATSPTLVTPVLGAASATSINVSGIATINQLDVNQLSPDGSNYGTVLYVPVANGSGGWNWATVASAGAGNLNGIDIREEGTIVGTAGSTTSIDFRGNNIIATGTAGGAIATVRVSDTPTFDSLVVSSGSTFTNGPILVGTATSTGTASQRLQVTGGAYVSGNLGIGTTNPGYNLDVNGTANITTQISLWGKTIGQPQTLIEPGKIYATSAGLGPGDLLLQSTGGNLGIGLTNPVTKLHLVGNLFLEGGNYFTANTSGYFFAGNGSYAGGIFAGSSGNLVTIRSPQTTVFENNGSEKARLDASGNIGIGTTNPTSKLHVVGDVRVTGVVTATTFVGALTGTATSTTNIPNLTGDITSVNSVTSIAAGVIVDADINASAGIVDTKLATISTALKVSNSATTATNANTASAIVARDASGNFSAGTITANLTGTATSTTNIPNLTGDVTSNGTTTAIAAGVIVDADINASAGIVDTKLATISTALKVSNSATTATNANTASAIVARDASGNFSAGTITANLTGTATSTTNIPNLTGAITSNNTTTSLGSFTSAQLATALTDETGSGSAVFATSPTLVTPSLGAASATSINSSGIVTATQFVTGASGSAIGINTNTISGPATITIDPAAVGDNTGLVVIKGDLQIDGTTTTINSTTVTVDDKNIILGSGAINDAAADGSGITIESGNGNKTFQFEDTGDNLGSSENLNVASGKVYKVNNTSVLSATTLGSGVVNSSLTSVGTLGQLQVTGISTFTNGPILVGTATSTGTASQPLQVTGGAYVSGNLGVGASNPGNKLVVLGTFGLSESNGSSSGRTLFSTSSAGFVLNHNDNSPIYFQTQGVTRLVIDDSGNIKLTSNTYQALAHKNFGYSGTYGAVVIGATGNNYTNVSLGVDVSTIAGGNFPGQNQVIFPSNGALVPNNAGTNFIGVFSRNSSDSILIGPDTVGGIASGPLTVTGTTVGIGTVSPAEKLHIHSDLAVIRLSGSAVSQTPFNIRQGIVGTNNGGFSIYDVNNSATRFAIDPSGNIGIGTNNPTYKLHVVGSFGATTKSFVIDHPTKEGKKLQYGSLEGPENGVYIRGRTQEATIELPEYWTKLVDAESITVSLTPIGNSAMPRVEKVSDNTVYVFSKEEGEMDYYYTIFAERCDVAKLEVEF